MNIYYNLVNNFKLKNKLSNLLMREDINGILS